MIEYTISDNLNITLGGSESLRNSDDQNSASVNRPVGSRDQHGTSRDSFTEGADGQGKPVMNVQRAFRALQKLMYHRQDLEQLSKEIINVYTEMLQVDGACVYTCTSEGTFEVLDCNTTWSNIFSTLKTAEDVDRQNIFLPPAMDSPCNSNLNTFEVDRSSNVVPVSFGTRSYGSMVSLPLVCDGTTVGAISLFSVNPQFLVSEHIEVFRMVASLAASLYRNIQIKTNLEKEQLERVTLQKDNQAIRTRIASVQHPAETSIGADAAYDELEALSYSVSHDLRAPIRAIRNHCEWLNTQHSANLDTEGRTLVQQITASSEFMENLLDGLLEFSKVVRPTPQRSLMDMTMLVRSVIDELLKNDGGSSSISIAVQPLLPAHGDPIMIRQVWYNLLSNAFKYTRYKQQREIAIDSFPFNGGVKYCVRDNGVGFDMQYVDRLFGAFHRLHAAEDFEGIGVGLAIVQRIVRRHGGEIWAEGSVDHGARFYFTLP